MHSNFASTSSRSPPDLVSLVAQHQLIPTAIESQSDHGRMAVISRLNRHNITVKSSWHRSRIVVTLQSCSRKWRHDKRTTQATHWGSGDWVLAHIWSNVMRQETPRERWRSKRRIEQRSNNGSRVMHKGVVQRIRTRYIYIILVY